MMTPVAGWLLLFLLSSALFGLRARATLSAYFDLGGEEREAAPRYVAQPVAVAVSLQAERLAALAQGRAQRFLELR